MLLCSNSSACSQKWHCCSLFTFKRRHTKFLWLWRIRQLILHAGWEGHRTQPGGQQSMDRQKSCSCACGGWDNPDTSLSLFCLSTTLPSWIHCACWRLPGRLCRKRGVTVHETDCGTTLQVWEAWTCFCGGSKEGAVWWVFAQTLHPVWQAEEEMHPPYL